MMRPTPPSTSCRRSISRITSLAETQSGSLPVSLTPQISGILVKNGSPAMAMATSRPPAPIASMPIEPAAGVWLSEPTMVLPGLPKCCMCTACEMPLPGREKCTPKRWQALCRNRWSSGFLKSSWIRLWSTYCADSSVFTRSRFIASSSSITRVPVASWVRVWSIFSAISSPGVRVPSNRCDWISLCATFMAMTESLRS